MNEYLIKVNMEKGMINFPDISLVQNDYNSTKFKFEFDKDYSGYTKVFKLIYPDKQTVWEKEIINDEVVLADINDNQEIVTVLTQASKYFFSVSVYDNNSKLTTSQTAYLSVRPKVGTTPVTPEEKAIIDDLINSVNQSINEVNNLNVEGHKENKKTTITLTKKDGSDETFEVLDGVGIERIETQESNEDKGQNIITITLEDGTTKQFIVLNGSKGEKGDAGSIKMIIVTELPETGNEETIYLIPSENPENYNDYDEYVFTNNKWELIGGASVQVDLTDYVKFTDYASPTQAGVIKASHGYGVQVGSSGILMTSRADKNLIDGKTDGFKPITSKDNDYAVKSALARSRLTKETAVTDEEKANVWTDEEKNNARNLLSAVGKTDFATAAKQGIVKIGAGLNINADAWLSISKATDNEIITKTGVYKPLVPDGIDLITKTGVTTNTIALTDEEKESAKSWLGINEIGTWELIQEIIADGVQDKFEFKDLNLKQCRIVIETTAGTEKITLFPRVRFSNWESPKRMGYIQYAVNTSTNVTKIEIETEPYAQAKYCSGSTSATTHLQWWDVNFGVNPEFDTGNLMDIYIGYENEPVLLPEGSFIRVYGLK